MQPNKGSGWRVPCGEEPTATLWLKGFNLLRKIKSPFLCCHGNSSAVLWMLCRRLPRSRAGERAFFPMKQEGCLWKNQSCQLFWFLQGLRVVPQPPVQDTYFPALPSGQEKETWPKSHSSWLWSRVLCLKTETPWGGDVSSSPVLQLYPTRTEW